MICDGLKIGLLTNGSDARHAIKFFDKTRSSGWVPLVCDCTQSSTSAIVGPLRHCLTAEYR